MFLSIANAVDEDMESLAEEKADLLFCAAEAKPPAVRRAMSAMCLKNCNCIFFL
jgi:hypothetical protein